MNSTRLAAQEDRGKPPLRPIAFAHPDVHCATAGDGTMRVRSRTPLSSYEPSLALLFRAAVERNPSGIFLAERDAGGASGGTSGSPWRTLTYAAARGLVDALAQSLMDRGLSAE